MKGSYSVPTGSSRSPLIGCDSPSADSMMNRFISAMPSSMMLALGRKIPVEGRRDFLLPEQIVVLGLGKQAAAVDPGAEIGRDGDVGRRGDDARGQFAVAAREFVEHEPKALLGRHLRRRLEGELLRHLDHGRGETAAAFAVERRVRQECFELGRRPATGLRTSPIHGRGGCSARARHFSICVDRHQAGMVVLVALERQADALDGVGDEADRPVVIDRLEGLDHAGHVVAAEIGHQRQQFVVAAPVDQLRHLRPDRRCRPADACGTPRRPGSTAPHTSGSGSYRSSASAPRRRVRRTPPASGVPYFTITTSQPKLRNMDSNFSHSPSRTTASRLWRL